MKIRQKAEGRWQMADGRWQMAEGRRGKKFYPWLCQNLASLTVLKMGKS
ncbi:hypothetical protein [Fischerella sp. JS2]|nr:hypothetical protein [Fischerella sp. JS2]